MAQPQRGHLFGHRFFDDTLQHGHVEFDGDGDLYATRKTWAALSHSESGAAASMYVRDLGVGVHALPQRFFAPYEVVPVAEGLAEYLKPGIGRLPGFNTVHCDECDSAEWTRLVRWFMGHKTAWWCESCHRVVPTLQAVK